MTFSDNSELLLTAASIFGALSCAVLAFVAFVRSKRDLHAAAGQFGKTFSGLLIEMAAGHAGQSARRKVSDLTS